MPTDWADFKLRGRGRLDRLLRGRHAGCPQSGLKSSPLGPLLCNSVEDPVKMELSTGKEYWPLPLPTMLVHPSSPHACSG